MFSGSKSKKKTTNHPLSSFENQETLKMPTVRSREIAAQENNNEQGLKPIKATRPTHQQGHHTVKPKPRLPRGQAESDLDDREPRYENQSQIAAMTSSTTSSAVPGPQVKKNLPDDAKVKVKVKSKGKGERPATKDILNEAAEAVAKSFAKQTQGVSKGKIVNKRRIYENKKNAVAFSL